MVRRARPMRQSGAFTVCLIATALAGCTGESDTFTLYRSSALDDKMRIHVASFDTKNGAPYNQENCQITADLFRQQPGVTVRYWCEAGAFRE